MVPTAHGTQQLVAHPDLGQVSQPDGATDVPAAVSARHTAAQVTGLLRSGKCQGISCVRENGQILLNSTTSL